MKVEIVLEHKDMYYRTEIECPADVGFEVLIEMARTDIQSMYELVQDQMKRGVDRPRPIKDAPQA